MPGLAETVILPTFAKEPGNRRFLLRIRP